MSHPFTTIEDYPKKYREALTRAGAELKYDSLDNKLYITFDNGPAALTNSERFMLCRYLGMYKHAFKKVSFVEE